MEIVDKIIEVEKTLEQSDSGSSFRIPFNVPVNIQRLIVKYKVIAAEDADIDFGIDDTEGYRGWSNTRKNRIVLSRDYATPGYIKGEIGDGEWHMIIAAFRVRKSCKVQISIRMYEEKAAWYPGDLHMHSIHSDGSFTVEQVLNQAREAGLKFIALTDHNTFTQNDEFIDREDLVVIPGVELTTYKGHANCWGVKRPFSHFFYQNEDDEDQIMKYLGEAEESGALVSMNHPFYKDKWLWDMERHPFKFVEVINAKSVTGNRKAIDWWHGQLCKGKKMVAVGGSDVHRFEPIKWYGIPTTWVHARSKDCQGMLDAIEKGRVCIATSTEAPRVDFWIDHIKMGETYSRDKESMRSNNLVLGFDLDKKIDGVMKLYSSDGLVKEVDVTKGEKQYSVDVDSTTHFYRLELFNKQGELLTITNPIYL